MSSLCLLVCSCLTPQVGRGRREEPNHCDMFAMVTAGTLWICGGLEVASLSPGPSMTFSDPTEETSTVSLLMVSFPRGSYNDSQFIHPVHSEAAPISTLFLNPKGALSGNVLWGASSWSFPIMIKSSSNLFTAVYGNDAWVPIQLLLSSFLYHLRPIATVFRLLKF